MPVLTQDWSSLILLVFVLGLKHGFDADHLATIDGLTRWHSRRGARLANCCGALFSAGHGLVVMAVAVAASLLARQWALPTWLEQTGAWISIAFLLGLGLLNLYAVLSARPEQVVAPRGIKGRWLGGLTRAEHPLLIAGVGMLFALSFDTLSLALLFGFTAQGAGGTPEALLLGALFTLGMLVADGANGLWIARLIRRADETARIASRVLGLALGGMSLLVAAYGIARLLNPAVDGWSDGKELAIGMGLIVMLACVFGVAMRLARVPRTNTSTAG
ncbi:MAG: nickel transporter [Rubrivivax sp.]|nr:nickel transporter [Rubrivivax sp.]MBK8527581.1 nickel transporter [Rubrivivax sp.]